MEIRTANLKKSIEDMIDAGVRKTTFYKLVAESLAKTEREPRQIRRAKAFAYLLDNVKLEVLPFELLGGSIIGMWPLDNNIPSYEEQYALAVEAIENEISVKHTHIENTKNSMRFEAQVQSSPMRFALMERDHFDANIEFSRLQVIIKEIQDKYAGSDKITSQKIANTLEHFFIYDYGKQVMDQIDDLPWISANHVSLNYDMIINTGYGKLLNKIENKLANEKDKDKKEFYTAAKLSIEAAIRYIKRYAKEFETAAEQESSAKRSAELTVIAQTLSKVATEKAGSFREALQLLWITHIIANTELGSALSFARFDQYMFPFYEKDIEEGTITRDEVKELLCCMTLKVNEPKMRTVQSLTLAGTKPSGEDAANELTKVFLESARVVRLPYPNLAVRIADDLSPEWLYDEAIETIKKGFGMPMLVNDGVWIKNFLDLGYPDEIAREYYNMGCVEMMIQGKQADWLSLPNGFVSYPEILERLFDEYIEKKYKFDSFDSLFSQYLDNVKTKIRACGGEQGQSAVSSLAEKGSDPFASSLIDGCLDNGKDLFCGGTEVPAHIAVMGFGFATVVDSLFAIKALVFDKKKVSLEKIIEAARNNFKNNERLRLLLMNTNSHYGNDIDAVDEIAVKMFDTFTATVSELNDGLLREKYVTSFFSYTTSVSVGEITKATPDGRLAGEPLSDGIGPGQGKDTEGPTKLLNTLLKLNYEKMNGALATNIKINPSLFNTKSGTLALKNLLKTYIKCGGPQIQVNFVRQEDLIDAQKNPQKHRDLVVRIAGFCEYFINLDISQQNEVIKRTGHEAM